MKCFIKPWLIYIYIKTYFILLRQGETDAVLIAQEHVNNISLSLTCELLFHEPQRG